jgi:hypothetical protein
MHRHLHSSAIYLLLKGSSILLLSLSSQVCAGNAIFVQGGISGESHDGDKPLEGNNSGLATFETDYSGETVPSTDPGGKHAIVSPKLHEILKQVGILYYKGSFHDAMAALRPAEDIDPRSDEVLNAKAAILSESGDTTGAQKIYVQLTEDHPKAFTPKYDLAELLLMEKKYDEARKGFQGLLLQYPNCDLARFKILLTYLIQKNNEQAGVSLAELRQRGPSPISYYALAAVAFSAGDIAKGKEWINSAEKDFRGGRYRVLYNSLADIGFVIHGEYPPKK